MCKYVYYIAYLQASWAYEIVVLHKISSEYYYITVAFISNSKIGQKIQIRNILIWVNSL
jgi:hypothetical protein